MKGRKRKASTDIPYRDASPPPQRLLRSLPAAMLLLLPLASPVHAVVPGLAPGLIALLPQLIVLLFTMLALLASPSAWWRVIRYAARHPARSALAALSLPVLGFCAAGLAALVPAPAPAPPIAHAPGGFAPGDPLAARVRSSGPGPLSAPEVTTVPETGEGLRAAAGTDLFALAEEALLLRDGNRLASVDAALRRVTWSTTLESPLACGPLLFARRKDGGKVDRGAILLTAHGDGIAPVSPAGRLTAIDGRDGSTLGALDLSGRPRAAALADERVLVVLDGEVLCISLAEPGRPRELWTSERPAREAVSIAADECGRYYILDDGGLLVGGLEGGQAVELATYDDARPRGLAVRHSLAYVLAVGPAGALLECLDPALRGSRRPGIGGREGPRRWSRMVPRPLADTVAAAEFGLVLTHPRGLLILDASSGATLRDVPLEPPPLCPSEPAGASCLVLLEDQSVVRYSPGLDRIEWRIAVARPPASASPVAPRASLAACGSRLAVALGGEIHVLSESSARAGLDWSHWRCGPSRRGAGHPAQVPLEARVLWRSGVDAVSTAGEGALDPPLHRTSSRIVPLAGGCIALHSREGATRIDVLAGGTSFEALSVPGSARGIVRHGERVLVAVEHEGRGRLLCVGGLHRRERDAAHPLWDVPLPALSSRHVLACGEEHVLVCLRGSVSALRVHDGSRRWESVEAAGGAAPLVRGGRVHVACASAGGPGRPDSSLVTLDVNDGTLLWRLAEPGWRWGPPSLHGEILVVVASFEGEGRVVAIGARDGARLRETPAVEADIDTPVITSDEGIFVSLAGGGLLRFTPEWNMSGRIEPIGSRGRFSPPPVAALGAILIAGGAQLRCIDTAGLEPIWDIELSGPVEEIVLEGERVLAATRTEVLCIGAE
ncbi:MAG TPA: PQQ-binding-like beta-propeller repeat protein [Planctomycetota bacterium]|nr:PQQ-binding-like beta-propeller repeat protein [Planctomycetota bacterium]